MSMYQIVRNIDFCYGHRLLEHPGKCLHLHGHNGRAEILLDAERLDARGMVADFSEQNAADIIIESLLDIWFD